MMRIALTLCGIAVSIQPAKSASLANIFSSHAVLQRDTTNAIWGFAESGTEVTLLSFNGANISATTGTDGVWKLQLPAVAVSSSPTTLDFAASDGSNFALEDVLFGDVFLCSGQSNMGLPVNVLWNVSDVVAQASQYPLLRLYQAPGSANSSVPMPQFPTDGLRPWQTPLLNGTDNSTLLGFSAACYIFGTTLYDLQGGSVPIGLLLSAHGGTSILTWQSQDSVYECGDLPSDGWNASVLYNSNIYPLTLGPLSMRAAVWYQGEEDVGLGPTESYMRAGWYTCALPALIADWRGKLGMPTLPFVIQQLHAWIHDVNTTGISPGDFGLALFRALQQQVVETVPGLALSVAFDGGDPAAVMVPPGSPTYSPSGTVHPHCKYIPGRRIAAAMAGLLGLGLGGGVEEQAGREGQGEGQGEVPVCTHGGLCGRTPGPVSAYPNYWYAVATSYTLNGSTSNITVRVSFQPGSTGRGLLIVPWDGASNSSHCPSERGVNATYCDWFAIQVNDVAPVGTWYNASSVSVSPDGHGLVLNVLLPRPGLSAVSTRNGWSDWPVTTVYTLDGQPMLPWKKAITDS